MQFLSNGAFRPRHISLCAEQRDDRDAYERIFGCSVAFEAAASHGAIWFDPAVLEVQSDYADPVQHLMQRNRAQALIERLARQTLIDRVRTYLFQQLQAGHGIDCTLHQVAEAYDIPVRQMRADLAKADTSFRALIKDVRRDAACHLLRYTREDIDHISELVGFSETRNLYRAFGAWENMTPVEYREQTTHAGMPCKEPHEVLQDLIKLSRPASHDDAPREEG